MDQHYIKALCLRKEVTIIILKEGIRALKLSSYCCLYLELSILPIKCEIAIGQLLFPKKILDKNENDPVSQVYREMIKYEFEDNWARNVLDLRVRYSLPLNDENVRLLSKGV